MTATLLRTRWILLIMCLVTSSGVLADTFLDTFSTVSYSNQDGTQNWSSNWNETGDGGNSPSSGDIYITGGRLQLQNNNNSISRAANLSAYSVATLSFDYEIQSFENGDTVYLEIRTGGSGTWTTLDTFTNADASSGTRSYNISAYINATTEIRFRTRNMSRNDHFYVDNVLISASTIPAPVADYRFDELAWSGAAGEVIDSSGNGHNGTALQTGSGVQTISDGFICRGGTFPDISSDTSYAVDTGLTVSSDIGNSGAISIWHRSGVAWTSTGSDKTLWDASSAGTDNKYFYLVLLSDGRLRFGMEDSFDGDYRIETTNPQNIAAGTWANITVNWDVNGTDQAQIWVNGVQQAVTFLNNTMNGSTIGNTYTLYIGDNRSTYYPQGSNRSAAGDIDEVLVFNQALSGAQIGQIYTLQSNGLNLDGTARVCPATALAQYHFDEASWTGAAGEVTDSSGSGYNATAHNGLTTSITTPDPAIPGDPGTCRYGDFDGSNDYVQLPSSFPNLTGSFTITAWIYAQDITGDKRIFIDDENNTGGYGFSLGDGGNGKLRFFSRNVNPISVDTQNAVITANSWHFVAAVHDATNKTRQIYVDGVPMTLNNGSTVSSYNGKWGTDTGPATIGGETDASSESAARFHFNGMIDEVSVYDGVLSQSEINTLRLATHPCSVVSVDHYSISYTGSAITCEPITVTITGHDISHNAVAPPAGTTISLSTSTGQGRWSNPSEGTLVDNGGGNASYTFGGSSSITLSFNHPVAGAVNFNINSGSSPNEGTGTEDPTVNFVDSGFRIVDASGNPIATQISAKPSGTGSSQLYLQAVRTDTNTMACVNAFAPGTVANVDWAAECTNPSTCIGGTQLQVDYTDSGGNQTAALTAQNSTAAPTYTTLPSMLFASNSETPIQLTYPEAGQIQLLTRYQVLDGTGSGTGNYINGNTQFLVKPVGFCVQAQTMGSSDPACATAPLDQCSKYVAAGNNFNLLIAAKAWQSNTDTNLCDNATTQNFASSNVALTSNLVAPSGGVNGSLSVSSGITLNSGSGGGQILLPETFSEVGVFTFDALDNNYFGDTVSGGSVNVGRFIPDHFDLVPAASGAVVPGNGSGSGVTYLNQPFKVSYTLIARSAGGTTTQNYEGSFAKLDPAVAHHGAYGSGAYFVYGAVDSAAPTSFDTRLTPTAPSGLAWSAGTLDVTDLQLNIARNAAPETPYSSVKIGINVNEPDGVGFLPASITLDTNADTTNDSALLGDLPGSLFYGRASIPPVYGPEINAGDLTPVPFEIQYYNGSIFVTNTADSSTTYNDWIWTSADCTDPDTTDNLTCSDSSVTIPTTGTTVNGGDDGVNLITVSRPGINKSGTLDMKIQVDPWLQYNWNGSGDEDPTTPITFGSHRGNDRIIYWREVP